MTNKYTKDNPPKTVEELYQGVADGLIISDIDLQRGIVYDNHKQEMVVDSIVKGIPLPAFYLWKKDDGTLEVLDGKQRIEAIKKFRQNQLTYDDETWAECIGIQDDFKDTPVSVIVCEGDEELRREIFYRINTLGVALSDYEVLNGLFHGEYLRGLDIYAKSSIPQSFLKSANKSPDRGECQYELLTYLMTIKNSDINDYVSNNKGNSFDADKKTLDPIIKFIVDVFDDDIRKKLGQKFMFDLGRRYHKNKTIWKKKKDELNEALTEVITSDTWTDKNIAKPVKMRWAEETIMAIVDDVQVDPQRFFTPKQKQELIAELEADGEVNRDKKKPRYQCKKCERWFYDDELEMDHMEPWSTGGRTVLSNAQLLCSACNGGKGNKENDNK